MSELRTRIAYRLINAKLGLTVQEIAEPLGVKPTVINGTVTQMAYNGFVEKGEKLPEGQLWMITEKGFNEFNRKFEELVEEEVIKPNVFKEQKPKKDIPKQVAKEVKESVTPDYYKGKTIQVFDVLEEFLPAEAVNGFHVGNIIKYVLRYRGKNGREDLLKARDYLNKLIDSIE